MDVISYVLAKAYTDKAIAEAEQIGFNVVIVEELPPIGQPKTIYLKHRSDGQYEEWMYVSNAWRKIGADIDLSGYATKVDLQELTSSVDQKIAAIQDDLVDNYVQSDQAATDSILGLVKSSSVLNGITVSTNGTMSVNSVGVDKLENIDGTELVLNSN